MFRNLSPGMIGVQAPVEQTLIWAAQYGFEAVTVPLEWISGKGAENARGQFHSHGLRPSVFGLPVEFRSDDAAFDDGFAKLPEQAKLASSAGLTRCSTWVLPGRKDLSDADYFELLKKRLGSCAKVLADHGIRFGMEFIGPKTLRDELGLTSPGLSTAEKMLELADAFNVPGSGLLLDSWHWHTSHGTPDLFNVLTNDMVVDVHTNDAPAGIPTDELVDNKRDLPGATGVIDLAAFFAGLKKIGYDGPVECEPFNAELSAMEDEAAVAKTAEALKKFLA